ncbi:nuclear transport factor 2 family protein [Maricaulis sp.]|uniref:nuclear transport factor 2 family protein n=1 Tax=Maricaulis sp. TaxID=1486257 RepID=UPI0026372BEA|nr:nuclear transport factor 2 family protein [Maricaulis sp.]
MHKFLTLIGLVAALASPALAQDDADNDSETGSGTEGVRAAVMAYFNAGNQGDADLARQAFYTEEGVMFIHRSDADGDRVEPMNLGDFADRFGRANPDRNITFHDITVSQGHVASAHITIDFGERTVDDMFLLYNINGEWKIVAKAMAWY